MGTPLCTCDAGYATARWCGFLVGRTSEVGAAVSEMMSLKGDTMFQRESRFPPMNACHGATDGVIVWITIGGIDVKTCPTMVRRVRMDAFPASFVACAFVARTTVAILVLGVLSGCQAPTAKERTLLLFPPPPGTPRVQFLTWVNGANDVEEGAGALERFVLGEEDRGVRNLNKPYGLAVLDGAAFVCDSKGLSIARMDFKNKTYSLFGIRGPGRLRKPVNIVIDPLGYKFVADTIRKQIVVFGPDDQYATAFDLPEPARPVDVAVYGNELYVLDNDKSCQIVVLDRRTGEVLRTFGSPGSEPGQFRLPSSMCIGPEGFLYVSDTMNWRVQKIARDGKPVWAVGQPGYQVGQFGRPRGVRVGPDGIVYVVDGATEIVQMYDSDGNPLMHFGGPGTTPGALDLPSSLAVDRSTIPYFQDLAHEKFDIDYLVFVVNQYGAHLVNVYAFGRFPDGFKAAEHEIATIPAVPEGAGVGPADSSSPSDSTSTVDKPTPSDRPLSADPPTMGTGSSPDGALTTDDKTGDK
jgi:DNA-binding beta-propeller fold protein YncE